MSCEKGCKAVYKPADQIRQMDLLNEFVAIGASTADAVAYSHFAGIGSHVQSPAMLALLHFNGLSSV